VPIAAWLGRFGSNDGAFPLGAFRRGYRRPGKHADFLRDSGKLIAHKFDGSKFRKSWVVPELMRKPSGW